MAAASCSEGRLEAHLELEHWLRAYERGSFFRFDPGVEGCVHLVDSKHETCFVVKFHKDRVHLADPSPFTLAIEVLGVPCEGLVHPHGGKSADLCLLRPFLVDTEEVSRPHRSFKWLLVDS